MNLWHKKMLAIGIICLLVGLFVGSVIGTYVTVKAVSVVGASFLDEELVEEAITRYKNQIAGQFPILNGI